MLACSLESAQASRMAVALSDGALISYDLATGREASQVCALPPALRLQRYDL